MKPLPAIPGLHIHQVRALAGPNIWLARQALEVHLDHTGLAFQDWPAADELLRAQKLPPTNATAFPSWLGGIVIQIQREGRSPVAHHAWCAGESAAQGRLVIEFEEEAVGTAALHLALRWLAVRMSGGSFDMAAELETFTDLAYDIRLGNSTRPAAHAAAARGIPVYRLDGESLVQLGQGCRQRRIQRSTTSRTGFIANNISCDKTFTKQLLAEMGIPVPRGRLVSDADDACAAAREAGFPVVVKPRDGDYGNGVTMRITTEADVRPAYAEARQWSADVLVEHHVAGHLFRLLVIGGRLVAAVRREPWFVVGDGRSTLLQLIEAANFDPRRGPEHGSPFERVRQQTGAYPQLTEDQRAPDSTPAAGETVPLCKDIYLRNDGIHLDQTDLVHPHIARLAIDATALVGLDIGGLDVIATDLAKAPAEQEFVILEVNAEPAIILHMEPRCVPSRPVGEAVVDSLFPHGADGRVALTVVLGDDSHLARARGLAAQRPLCGLASRAGAWLDGFPLGAQENSLVRHARRVWKHPRVAEAVLHVTLQDILEGGLPFDRCDTLIDCLPADAAPTPDLRRAREVIQATLR